MKRWWIVLGILGAVLWGRILFPQGAEQVRQLVFGTGEENVQAVFAQAEDVLWSEPVQSVFGVSLWPN